MQSCSNELDSKVSKPKISNTPMLSRFCDDFSCNCKKIGLRYHLTESHGDTRSMLEIIIWLIALLLVTMKFGSYITVHIYYLHYLYLY